ncbi:hypothetical protein PR048_007844 [Dryococelus australis]|uniref:Uncharacterized protein n=1 Tax=Dryococelus australis TaxID=614101 RepID=A0ABQ9HW98_9NEOP|nr:hypothetical protein PR048_007844 [Dryococelus australis]
MKGRGKRDIPDETRRPTASSGTILTCENSVTQPGIEPGWVKITHQATVHAGTRTELTTGTWKERVNVHYTAHCNLRVRRSIPSARAGMQARGETGDPRENPSTSSIVRHDSHVRKSGRDIARNKTRLFASHQGEPHSIPGGVTPGFSHVGIAGRYHWWAGFLGDIPFPPALRLRGEVWSALNCVVLRADEGSEVSPEQNRNSRAEEMGDPRETPADQRHRLARLPPAKKKREHFASSSQDKLDVKHVHTGVDFSIGSLFFRQALDDSVSNSRLARKQVANPILPDVEGWGIGVSELFMLRHSGLPAAILSAMLDVGDLDLDF